MDKGEFSGANYLERTAGTAPALDITGEMTIEAKINLDELPSVGGTSFSVVAKENATAGTDNRSFNLQIHSSNTVRLLYWDSAGNLSRFSSAVSLSTGTDYHIGFKVDPATTTAFLYLNGLALATTTLNSAATSIAVSTANFTIGARGATGSENYFKGKIDDVRVWNLQRTEYQICSNANTTLAGTETGLVANYLLDGDGADNTANAYALSNVNTVTFSAGAIVPTTDCSTVTPEVNRVIFFGSNA